MQNVRNYEPSWWMYVDQEESFKIFLSHQEIS